MKNFQSLFSLKVIILISVSINLLGNYVFFCGFLPNSSGKAPSTSFSTTGDIDKLISPKPELGVTKRFDRLVFIIIDAFRADFAFGFNKGYMPFLKHKIQQNESHSFVSKASLPTVTMPRIKGITSGSIPSFYEILFNSVSSEYNKDNIIEQFHKDNFSMVFYGDDTWLKLFPNKFKRVDGTNSFYVNDYTEVDNNVTRHLESDLEKQDWDVLILHYLGLDHIGHTAGPFSPLIGNKLIEMDEIIADIYRKIVKDDSSFGKQTLMVITGDHGMSNAGSHGGASEEEVNTPVIFLSSSLNGKSFTNSVVKQTDIANTIATLFGLNIPFYSIGKPMPIISDLYSPDEVKIINQNVGCQLLGIISSKIISISEKELLKDLCYGYHTNPAIIDNISDRLHKNSSEYHPLYMIGGIFLMTLSTVCAFIITKGHLENLIPTDKDIFLSTFSVFWTGIVLMSLLSSSFIEEEQYIHYHFWPFYLILLFVYKHTNLTNTLALLVIQRVLRAWTRTGVKWSGLLDIEDILRANKELLLFVMVLGTFVLLWKLKRHSRKPLFLLLLFLVFWFKSCDTLISPVFCSKTIQLTLPRMVLVFALLQMILNWRDYDSIKIAWMFVSFILLRPTNFPWFCFVVIADELIMRNVVPVYELIFIYFGISHFCYFAQGNSNNFSTVDIAAGMIGLTEFHPVLSLLFSFLATFCTKFYWDISFISTLQRHNPKSLKYFGMVICLYQMVEVAIYCVVVFLMRYHLFIWSVFAPKYFYLLVQSLLNFLMAVPILLVNI